MDTSALREALLAITADDGYAIFVNGVEVAESPADATEGWRRPLLTDVTQQLAAGDNVIAVLATNAQAGPAGLLIKLAMNQQDGTTNTVVSDDTWRALSGGAPSRWERANFDDGHWPSANVSSPYGGGPWLELARRNNLAK